MFVTSPPAEPVFLTIPGGPSPRHKSTVFSGRLGKCPRFMSGRGGNRFPVAPHLAGKVAQNANHHFRRPIENRRADLRPLPPRAICPLGPGLGQGQKAKGLRGHPGRHDGLPGAGLRCTFAQQGSFGGFHVSSAVLISPSAQSRTRPYVWTAGMQTRTESPQYACRSRFSRFVGFGAHCLGDAHAAAQPSSCSGTVGAPRQRPWTVLKNSCCNLFLRNGSETTNVQKTKESSRTRLTNSGMRACACWETLRIAMPHDRRLRDGV